MPAQTRKLVAKIPIQTALLASLGVCILVIVLGCHNGRFKSFSGSTMGTYYRISVVCSSFPSHSVVEDELRKVDEVMSNYRDDSHVALFNNFPVGKWFDAPLSLVHVVAVAHQVSEMSTGKFDITVEPLVSAWGFGAKDVGKQPTKATVERIIGNVDYRKLEYRTEPPGLLKAGPLTIDLSGIAKGYGVDRIAELLDEYECGRYLVDIGGEIRVSGLNQANVAWQIGIEVPDGSGTVHSKIGLSHGAVATTGDYRNFREFEGQTYAHLLDPTTGLPLNFRLASVTVFMATAVEADALATALFVLGEEAYEVAVENEIAAVFLTWDESKSDYSLDSTPNMDELRQTRGGNLRSLGD